MEPWPKVDVLPYGESDAILTSINFIFYQKYAADVKVQKLNPRIFELVYFKAKARCITTTIK